MTELIKDYVTVLRNNPNINSEHTIKSYCSVVKCFCEQNKRPYRLSVIEIKKFMAEVRKKSDSYYNVQGSALKILYTKIFKQPNKMLWFKAIPTKQKFYNIISW